MSHSLYILIRALSHKLQVTAMATAMQARNIVAECECFDVGIVRSVKMYEEMKILAKVLWSVFLYFASKFQVYMCVCTD